LKNKEYVYPNKICESFKLTLTKIKQMLDIDKRYVGKVFAGEEFIALFPNLSENLIKLTNTIENHRGFQFDSGINEDTNTFNPEGKCSAGGIYFTHIDKLAYWVDLYQNPNHEYKYCRKVKILSDCKIYIEDVDSFKVDKIFLEDRVDISELENWKDRDYLMKSIRQNPFVIRYIKNPDTETQLEAVTQNGCSIKHIKNPTEEIKLEAITQNPFAIFHVIDPNRKMQLKAVQKTGYAIMFITNPMEEVKIEAVRQNGYALFYIKDQSKEVQFEALKQNKDARRYINT
jgi:hypothetical protein